MVSDWVDLTSTGVTDPLVKMVNYLPNVLGAMVVILIGVIVAWAVKTVIVRGLGFIKVKKYTDAVGLSKIFTEKVEVANLLGDLAKWTVVIVFLLPAFEILNLQGVNDVVYGILSYIPSVVLAIVSIVVGAVIADLAARVIRSTAATIGARTADFAADVAKWAIIVFVFLSALQQLNLFSELISVLTVAVAAFFAIAGGIAFGLGGKDAAADLIAGIRKSLPKK